MNRRTIRELTAMLMLATLAGCMFWLVKWGMQ